MGRSTIGCHRTGGQRKGGGGHGTAEGVNVWRSFTCFLNYGTVHGFSPILRDRECCFICILISSPRHACAWLMRGT
jgi:hypothetical protein